MYGVKWLAPWTLGSVGRLYTVAGSVVPLQWLTWRTDVLDVLMKEYRLTLVRQGYRRRSIDEMCREARNRLDEERESPTGIVCGRYSPDRRAD